MNSTANYHCPVCGTLSQLVISEIQAFCTNEQTCNVINFDPSKPDGGMSNPHFIDETGKDIEP